MAEAQPRIKRRQNDIPAVLRISLDKAKEFLERRKRTAVWQTNGQEDQRLHCLIDKGMHQNGYPSYSWSHDEANIQVSHLALRVEKGEHEVPHRSRRETASHLCHNKSCAFEPTTSSKETVGSNGRRNGCLAFVAAPCCGILVNACGHEPRCLLPFNK